MDNWIIFPLRKSSFFYIFSFLSFISLIAIRENLIEERPFHDLFYYKLDLDDLTNETTFSYIVNTLNLANHLCQHSMYI